MTAIKSFVDNVNVQALQEGFDEEFGTKCSEICSVGIVSMAIVDPDIDK